MEGQAAALAAAQAEAPAAQQHRESEQSNTRAAMALPGATTITQAQEEAEQEPMAPAATHQQQMRAMAQHHTAGQAVLGGLPQALAQGMPAMLMAAEAAEVILPQEPAMQEALALPE